MSDYTDCYNLVWNNNDDVVIYETLHHPYEQDGQPWGPLIEVAHNLTQNEWVKIIPATGSFCSVITEEEALELMEDGAKIKWVSPNHQ